MIRIYLFKKQNISEQKTENNMENRSGINKKSNRIHTAIQVEYEKSGIIIILPRDYNPTVDRVSDESILERQLLRTLNLKGQLSRNEFDNFCSCCFGLI